MVVTETPSTRPFGRDVRYATAKLDSAATFTPMRLHLSTATSGDNVPFGVHLRVGIFRGELDFSVSMCWFCEAIVASSK